MRAFVAIDLPEQIRAALRVAQEDFRAFCPEGRWTKPDGIHLTLKFLGEIPDARVKQVTETLKNLGRFEEFAVEVRGFGFFPDPRRPRVFWAGIKAPPDLSSLAARVETSMEKLGFAREGRAYSPHLTLARFKIPRPQPALQAAAETKKDQSLGVFRVSEFFLFESRLAPQGADYRKVVRFQG